jgi:hypothetical protein
MIFRGDIFLELPSLSDNQRARLLKSFSSSDTHVFDNFMHMFARFATSETKVKGQKYSSMYDSEKRPQRQLFIGVVIPKG